MPSSQISENCWRYSLWLSKITSAFIQKMYPSDNLRSGTAPIVQENLHYSVQQNEGDWDTQIYWRWIYVFKCTGFNKKYDNSDPIEEEQMA